LQSPDDEHRGARPRLATALLLGAALLAAAPLAAIADAAADATRLDARLQMVGKLIESSSGARSVADSSEPRAVARREQARELHARAAAALDGGDTEAAAGLLQEASQLMFEAVRLASGEAVAAAKQSADFDDRLSSTRALLEAHARVSEEKGQPQPEVAAAAGPLIAEAEALHVAGEHTAARATLDRAYQQLKVAIEALRTGDTLVRSLDFASKEEEYHYEIDRNDTHQMLVVILVEKKADPRVLQLTRPLVERATELRQRAEDEAGRGDHASAVQTLEDATMQLVRAIRMAGVYIPN